MALKATANVIKTINRIIDSLTLFAGSQKQAKCQRCACDKTHNFNGLSAALKIASEGVKGLASMRCAKDKKDAENAAGGTEGLNLQMQDGDYERFMKMMARDSLGS